MKEATKPRTKKFYIKERHNPQFKKPYYSACGQLTRTEANKIENGTVYGVNIMMPYETEQEYKDALAKLKEGGFNVYDY